MGLKVCSKSVKTRLFVRANTFLMNTRFQPPRCKAAYISWGPIKYSILQFIKFSQINHSHCNLSNLLGNKINSQKHRDFSLNYHCYSWLANPVLV